jgi:hypothetical protein
LHQALRLLRELLPAAFPGIEIEAILENVSSMKAAYRDEISALCDTAPYKLCPSDVWPVLRPRFWWLTYALDNHRYLDAPVRLKNSCWCLARSERVKVPEDNPRWSRDGKQMHHHCTKVVPSHTQDGPRILHHGAQ